MTAAWPDGSLTAHGPVNRLPPPLQDNILTSKSALAEAYQGPLFEYDSQTGANQMHRVNDATASEIVNRGTTAYLENIAPLLPEAAGFLNDLEQELDIEPGSARMTAFIAAPGRGAPVHYDASEVISIQLVGSKKFFLSPMTQIRFPYGRQYGEGDLPFRALYPQVSNGFPRSGSQSFEMVTMQPGSILLMPRGTWHYTEAEQDSISVSIVLNPPTQLDFFLSQLKSTLLQDPAWRAPCYGLATGQRFDARPYRKVSNTIYRMAKCLQNPESPVRGFHRDSRYLRNPTFGMQVDPAGNLFDLHYSGLVEDGGEARVHMQVPQDVARVFEWFMCKDKPFTVGECMQSFPGLPDTELRHIFSKAEETGLLKKLWFVALA